MYHSRVAPDSGWQQKSAAVSIDDGDGHASSTLSTSASSSGGSGAELSPVGIEISGWRIITQNSSIGDEKGMDRLTLLLEDVASHVVSVETNGENTSNNTDTTEQTPRSKRRLCPPEITFLDAIVSLQFTPNNTNDGDEQERTTEIRFTAQDALMEWTEAHRFLDHSHNDTQKQTAEGEDIASSATSPSLSYRGVSILRTVDANAWSSKRPNATTPNSVEFYYDWTFASPYAGTIQSNKISASCGINNRSIWQPLERSRIPFHLLQDTSQPILLYDDIPLYEDDLHDNGDVSMSVKVRVMPQCWYVLQRLFLRVDYVCVKCREVRMFCFFGGEKNLPQGVEKNKIYRDVLWREASWEDLGMLGLPLDPGAWREESNVGAVGAPMTSQSPPLAALLTRMPSVSLPGDLPRYSFVNVGTTQKQDRLDTSDALDYLGRAHVNFFDTKC